MTDELKRPCQGSSSDDDAFQKLPSKKKRYSEVRKNECNNISSGDFFNTLDVESEDEIFYFSCPKELDPYDVFNENASSCDNSKSYFTATDGKRYGLKFIKDPFNIDCIVEDQEHLLKYVRIPLNGQLTVCRKSVSNKVTTEENEILSDSVKFPENLKPRHPLLGYKWKEHYKKASNIEYLKSRKIKNVK